jgi:type I restriction enzyme S subunit
LSLVTKKKIGDLFKISKGKKSEEDPSSNLRYIQIDDLRNDNNIKLARADLKNVTCTKLDVLIAWDGANAGTIGYDLEGVIGSTLAKLVPKNDSVNSHYAGRFLQSKFRYLRDNCTGATIPHISKPSLVNLDIPLPLLDEQKKIAEILDATDSLRQKDKQLVEHYDRLSQSLFLDMFGDPVCNMKKWETKKLEDIASSQLGKMLSQAAKKGINAQKYLRNANVRWGYFNLDNMLEMDFTDKEIKKFNLLAGDILVCEGGEVGRSAIWRNDLEDCYFQKALHRVRVNNEMVTPEYLQAYFYWMSKLGGLSSSTSEVTFSHLTAEKLKKLIVPLPPVSLQNEYSSKLSYVEKQKELAQQALLKSDDLFNSLLQQAFKGKLTNC